MYLDIMVQSLQNLSLYTLLRTSPRGNKLPPWFYRNTKDIFNKNRLFETLNDEFVYCPQHNRTRKQSFKGPHVSVYELTKRQMRAHVAKCTCNNSLYCEVFSIKQKLNRLHNFVDKEIKKSSCSQRRISHH